MRHHSFLPLLVFACSCASEVAKPKATNAQAPVVAEDSRVTALQATLRTLSEGHGGIVAISVTHVASGGHASVNGDVRMPMMSVFKLPLTIATLAAIDDGAHELDEVVPLRETEIRSHVSPIADDWKNGVKSPTLETLLRRVIQDSDNTAGDKLVTFDGGGLAITTRLRKLGIAGVDIAEEEIDIFARMICAGTPRPTEGWSEQGLHDCPKATEDAKIAAAKVEMKTPPNGATADAMNALLVKLDRGEVLSKTSNAWLMSTLEGTRTGPKRLKGLLPEGTRVAHKTGTGEDLGGFNMATNDVGIVWLPDGTHVSIAVLTSGCTGDLAEREGTIAKAAKAAYDAFR